MATKKVTSKKNESSDDGKIKNNTIKKLIEVVHNKNTALPALDCILFKKTEIVCSNIETSIIIPFESGVDALLPIKQMKIILDEYQNGTWSRIDKNEIAFVSEADKIVMQSSKITDFVKYEPDANKSKLETIGTITPDVISQMTEASNFVGCDELRSIMSRVYVFDQIVSTDAHKMFYEDIKGEAFKEICLFPIDVVKCIAIVGGNWTIQKYNFDNQIACISDLGIKIIFRQETGNYPNYKGVFPDKKELVNSFVIDSDEMQLIHKKISKFYNTTTKQMSVSVADGKVKFHASDFDFNTEFNTTVDAETKGQINIGFNADFLNKIMKQFKGKVEIKMSAPNRAAIINDKYLLMPVMINK